MKKMSSRFPIRCLLLFYILLFEDFTLSVQLPAGAEERNIFIGDLITLKISAGGPTAWKSSWIISPGLR